MCQTIAASWSYLGFAAFNAFCVLQPDEQGGVYREYSDADKWADLFLTKSVFETSLSVLNEALDAASSACDIRK